MVGKIFGHMCSFVSMVIKKRLQLSTEAFQSRSAVLLSSCRYVVQNPQIGVLSESVQW